MFCIKTRYSNFTFSFRRSGILKYSEPWMLTFLLFHKRGLAFISHITRGNRRIISIKETFSFPKNFIIVTIQPSCPSFAPPNYFAYFALCVASSTFLNTMQFHTSYRTCYKNSFKQWSEGNDRKKELIISGSCCCNLSRLWWWWYLYKSCELNELFFLIFYVALRFPTGSDRQLLS